MKTKILSVLLACLMVVSVLPMSVFAADPACTLVGDKDHTLVNCPDATKIEVVPTVCEKWGYTLYQCPACGDYFADDFVQPQDNHDYSIEVSPEVAPTCQKKGKTAVMQCSKCGDITGGEDIKKVDHDWVLTEGNCLAEGILTCSMCQRTKKVNGTGEGHAWNTIPEIVTKPSCEFVDGVIVYTDGVAKYTCSACGDVKNVVIKAAHMKEAMTHVAYKAPTCTEAGNIEYWVCVGCGDENKACGAIFVADPTDASKLVEASKDEDGNYEIAIPAHGHDFNGQVAHATPAPVAPTCTTAGSEVKTCNICNEDITLVLPALGHTADLNGPPYDIVAPTCDRYGYEIWICLVCGEHAQTNVLPMVGHQKPANYVGPDCLYDATYNCAVCNKLLTEKATGHNEVTVTVPYNCVTFTYTYTYCVNENCPLPLVDKTVVNGVEYDVTIPGATVTNRLSVHLIGEVVVDVNSGLDTAPDHVYRQTDKELYVEPTCTENGRYVYYCRYCREFKYENYGEGTEPALGHDMIIDITVGVNGVVAPTCTTYGYTAWKCQRVGCDHTAESDIVPQLGHNYDNGVVVYPTCTTPGYTLYTCDRCGHVKTDNHTTFTPNVEALFYINHADPTRIISVSHPAAQMVGIYLDGSCEERGLYRYFCPDCGEFLLVVKEGTGEGHTMPAGTVVVPATCLTDGSIASYICTVCGETVAEKILPKLGHIPGAAATCTDAQVCLREGCGVVLEAATGHDYESVKKLDPTCTVDGHSAYKVCKTCGYENGKTILPKLNHKNIKVNVKRDVSCELFGFVQYLCPDCDGDANGDLVFGDVEAEYIIGYRNALGHVWELSDTDSTDMTCESDGENVYYCAHGSACIRDDGTDFGKAWGKKTEVVKASGHQNAAGETIVNDCMDPVVDRVCVNEHCNLTPNADGLRIVAKDHQEEFKVWVEATCVSYAYYLIVCPKCQYNEIDDNSVIPEYGKHCWGAEIDDNDHWVTVKEPTWTEAGLAELRCCYGCEKILPEPIVHTKVLYKTGIEFTLDMDNAVVSGAGYADSSLVAVKINMNSYKVDVWGVRVNLAYDSSIVKYEGYEIVSDTFTVNQAAHDNGGYVTLVANTANTEDKQAQNLPLEGTETFAIVYFRVDNRYATKATFGFVNDAANDKVCEAIMADGTIIDTNVNTTVADADIAKYNKDITIEKFLDANADGDVSLEDALALYNAVKGSKYDVVIDTDKDGVITLVDLMNLYNYLVGSMSYDDVTALRG